MKASGVYFYLSDESVRPAGSASFVPCVVGISKKGSLTELNDVTARNLKDVLGYDLSYSPEMMGLGSLLEVCAHVKFLRINKDTLADNVYILTTDTTTSHTISDLEDPASLFTIEDLAFGVAHKDNGSWGNFYVRLNHRASKIPVSFATSQEFTLDINQTISTTEGFEEITDGGETPTTKYLYKGGALLDSDGNRLAVLISDTKSVGTSFDIYTLKDDQYFGTKIGEYTIATDPAEAGDVLELTGSTGYTNMTLSLFLASKKEYTLNYGSLLSSGDISIVDSYDFSLDSESEIFYKNVDFGDLLIGGSMALAAIPNALKDTWLSLTSGSNGTIPTSAASLNLQPLQKSGVNFLALNGISSLSVVNAVARKCDSLMITCFVDVPAFTSYVQANKWRSNVFSSAYVALGWVPDTDEDDNRNLVYIWPSINYLKIFAAMFESYGNVNNPPAGHTYGAITANKLLETDAADYANELKTNRINYQIVDNLGACIWEQRTTYGLESDLSYINTHCILRDLRGRLLDFMKNFNFRYTTASQLLVIDSGLKSIFDKFVTDGFIAKYEVNTPSFEEAQKMGREVDINMSCSVTQDGEVFNIRLTLQNYS